MRPLAPLALVVGEGDFKGVWGSMHNLPGRAPLVVHTLPVALRPLHLDGRDAASAPHLLQSLSRYLLSVWEPETPESLLGQHLQQTSAIRRTACPGQQMRHLSSQTQPAVVSIDVHELYPDASWGRAVHPPVLDLNLTPAPWCNLHMQNSLWQGLIFSEGSALHP